MTEEKIKKEDIDEFAKMLYQGQSALAKLWSAFSSLFNEEERKVIFAEDLDLIEE